MTMKGWAQRMVGGATLGIALALFIAGASAADKATFALDWVIYGKHAGFFAALDQGYYKGANLEVEIVRGFGSADTIKRIDAGSNDYGLADFGSLIVARSKGGKSKQLAVIHSKSLHAIFSLKGNGVLLPKDLEGKKVGYRAGGAVSTVLPALAAVSGLDLKKVELINMAPEALMPSLVAGKIEALTDTFQTEFPTLQATAQKMGKEGVSILFGDHGVDILANGLIARDDTIAKQTDRTRRWVDSTMRAFAWAVENPDEALKIFLKHNPAIDAKLARAHWEICVDHLLVPEAKEQGIGFMTRERVAYARDLLTRLMNLPTAVPVEDLYDIRFLPKLFPKRGPRVAF